MVGLKIPGVGYTLEGHQNIVEVDAVSSLPDVQSHELADHPPDDAGFFRKLSLHIFHIFSRILSFLPNIVSISYHSDLICSTIFIFYQFIVAEVLFEVLNVHHSAIKNWSRIFYI